MKSAGDLIEPASASASASLRDRWFLLSLAVILTNDLVLKPVLPGHVSGKASDIAGLVFFPVVLNALFALLRVRHRVALSLGLVTLWFIGLQLIPFVDATHEFVGDLLLPWSVRNTPDLTDLLVLPVAVLGHSVLTSPRPLRLSPVGVRLVIPLAGLACLAESVDGPSYLGPPVVDEGGAVIVSDDTGDARISTDGGLTFMYLSTPPITMDEIEAELEENPGARSACLNGAPRHCFRLGASPALVEESTDGGESWRSSWESTEDRLLLTSIRGSFDEIDERRRGVVVLPDNTVVVTTVAGPTLRWSPEDGWSPSVPSLRMAFWPVLLAASIFAGTAALFPVISGGATPRIGGSALGALGSFLCLLMINGGFLVLLLIPAAFFVGVWLLVATTLAFLRRKRRGSHNIDSRLLTSTLTAVAAIGAMPWIWARVGQLAVNFVIVTVPVAALITAVALARLAVEPQATPQFDPS